VARTLLAGLRTATTRLGGISLREVTVNGQPGAMVLDPSERLIGVLALDIAEGGQIQTVTSVINPDGTVASSRKASPKPRKVEALHR
jgi:hypothetical protein